MNLKEAFQAQNKLNELFEHFSEYLAFEKNVTAVKEKHFRSKAAEGQIDEFLDVTDYDQKIYDANKVIDFLLVLIDEREKVAKATLDRREMQYLYKEGSDYVMMDNETYDQLHVSEVQVGDGKKYLKENMNVMILLHEGKVIGVDIPAHVELEVVDTPPSEKGNTSQGGTKPATLETGAVVNVPFFVANGDIIRVDTRTNEYLDRV